MEIKKEVFDDLLTNIRRRMTPQPVKIRARKFVCLLASMFGLYFNADLPRQNLICDALVLTA